MITPITSKLSRSTVPDRNHGRNIPTTTSTRPTAVQAAGSATRSQGFLTDTPPMLAVRH
ncbi:hypothetical protein Acsp05_04280 [Actinokineospora sp. NBRC 105648]|nr:hypothetical protein Acsp05_04280 [Actinokineospora sp. NBRC 105648]